LYVTTNFYQNFLYISFFPLLSDNYFWCTQQAVVDVLRKHEDYTTIIKIHPNLTVRETPLRSYIKEKEFENCQFIKNEYFFSDLLSIADIVVIDFPSTVLLQALTTTKPIFVLLKHLRVEKNAVDLLKHRAYCYSGMEEFTKALNQYLDSGNIMQQIDLNNRDFLKLYGTHLDDGKNANRVVDVLMSSTKGGENK